MHSWCVSIHPPMDHLFTGHSLTQLHTENRVLCIPIQPTRNRVRCPFRSCHRRERRQRRRPLRHDRFCLRRSHQHERCCAPSRTRTGCGVGGGSARDDDGTVGPMIPGGPGYEFFCFALHDATRVAAKMSLLLSYMAISQLLYRQSIMHCSVYLQHLLGREQYNMYSFSLCKFALISRKLDELHVWVHNL